VVMVPVSGADAVVRGGEAPAPSSG
jgi:hypothetical protein